MLTKKAIHPGRVLANLLEERGISQKELSAKIDIANSLLSNILKGVRNINVNHALALEAAGFESASFWLEIQTNFLIHEAKNEKGFKKKENYIKEWNEIEESKLIPLSYLKKQSFLGIQSSEDVEKIYKMYGVSNFSELKSEVENYDLFYFRKSSKFAEEKSNVVAWSIVAEQKAKTVKVSKFDPTNKDEMVNKLKRVLYNNNSLVQETANLLGKYGIKFFTLDRPSKTPVEGKTFLSEGNPAIALSLRYKRLDYFAFTLMHELGHVFLHLTNPKYENADFFINNSKQKIEEFEADNFAQDNLIELEKWNDFILSNSTFSDEVIYEFAKKIKVHPGIIRGRVCFEKPEYYRKRTSITEENRLKDY